MSYETKQGEHGPEIYEDGERIVFTNDSGNWQAVHGKASQKADALAWYDETAGGSDEDATEDHSGDSNELIPDEAISDVPNGGQGEPDTGILPHAGEGDADFVPHETKESESIEIDEVTPTCPLPCDPRLGDKTPSVVEWWFKNHPELAAKKYAGRRFQR